MKKIRQIDRIDVLKVTEQYKGNNPKAPIHASHILHV